MRPPPFNLLGLAPLARPPGWCQLPPTLGCPPGPGGVSTDLQTVLVETSKATRSCRRSHLRAWGMEDGHVQPSEADLEVLQAWWGRVAPEVPPDAKGLWFGITDLMHGGALRTLY